jgi:hypothetical protein
MERSRLRNYEQGKQQTLESRAVHSLSKGSLSLEIITDPYND